MKLTLSIIFCMFLNVSNSQIIKLSPSKIYKVGEIEKCTYNKEGEATYCDWLMRLKYSITDNQRKYTLEYKVKYGDCAVPTTVIRRLDFYATQQEIDALYQEIQSLTGLSLNSPEQLNYNIGGENLKIYVRRFNYDVDLYLEFDKKESSDDNCWPHLVILNPIDILFLFGKD